MFGNTEELEKELLAEEIETEVQEDTDPVVELARDILRELNREE